MQVQEQVNLAGYNTFHISATARYFSSFSTLSELHELLNYLGKHSITRSLILGGGSNILLRKDFDGMILKNEVHGIEKINEDEEHVYIKAGAGENWHGLVAHCVAQNFAGLENLSLIPGNVGASPMQNIGAYGVEIRDVFYELEAVHRYDKSVQRFGLNDCGFGYRESVFKNKFRDQFVILNVTLRLNKKAVLNTTYGAIELELQAMGIKDPGIQDVAQAVINIRTSKLPDPGKIGNAGSFFKNPVIANRQYEMLRTQFHNIIAFPAGEGHAKLAAGWLIEQCGWKGYRKGDAGCYPKQALVLVNYGIATGQEIYDLSEEIIQSVQKKFGVRLEREVNII